MTIFDRIENWLDELPAKTKNWFMNIITINGERHDVEGNNIVVRKGKVLVNGKVIKDNLTDTVKIEFQGDLASLDCTQAIVNGNVHGDVDGTTITVNGDVSGNVDGTTIKCGDVAGDVDGTTVTCGKVKGDVDAMSVKKIVKK
jgi:hypothetical protein